MLAHFVETLFSIAFIRYLIQLVFKQIKIKMSGCRKKDQNKNALKVKDLDRLIEQELDEKEWELNSNKGKINHQSQDNVKSPGNRQSPGYNHDSTHYPPLGDSRENKNNPDIKQVFEMSKFTANQKRKETINYQSEIEKQNELTEQLYNEQLLEIMYQSKKEEEERQIAQKKAKEAEKLERQRKREYEQDKLTKALLRILSYNLLIDSDFEKMEILFNEFELNTGTPVNDEVRDRSSKSTNGKSSLILEMIHTLKYSSEVSIEKIFTFFGSHLEHIGRVCAEKQDLFLYDEKKHELDTTSQFSNFSLDKKLVTINIRGDGNCLWNSVSFALFGDYSMMESLRLLTASTLLKHKNKFKDYLNEQKSKYGYSHELSFEGLVGAATELQVWGDEIHIMALSLALRRPVYSYGSLDNFRGFFNITYEEFKKVYESDSLHNHFKYVADVSFEDHTPILLYYNGENHYSVVLPYDSFIEPVVPKTQILEPIFGRKNTDSDQNKGNLDINLLQAVSKLEQSEAIMDKPSENKSANKISSKIISFSKNESKNTNSDRTKVNLKKEQTTSKLNIDEKPKKKDFINQIRDNEKMILKDEWHKLKKELLDSQLELENVKTQLRISENENKIMKLKYERLENKLKNLEHSLQNKYQQNIENETSSSFFTESNPFKTHTNAMGNLRNFRTSNENQSTELSDRPGSSVRQNNKADQDETNSSMEID